MEAIYLRELGSVSFYLTINKDISGLNIAKDENNEKYLSGTIIFMGADFEYLLEKKKAQVIELEVLYGASSPVRGNMSLTGEWDYRAKVATLEVDLYGLYQKFERLLDNEIKYVGSQIEFDYDSEIYNVWGIGSYQSEYDNFVTCSANPDPPEWVDGKIYNGLTDYGEGAKAGDSDVAVYHNSKKWLSITPGNDSEPGVGDGVFRWLEAPSLTTIGQERAAYQFNDDAVFNELFQRWENGGCTADTYTNITRGYSIAGILTTFLENTEFSLYSNWLHYAENIDERYLDVYITNTEFVEVLTLQEVITYVETLFNVKWKLEKGQLTFKHWSELISEIKGAVPPEHDYFNREDIRVFKKNDIDEVYEHRLAFSDSPLETHPDSVITYDNSFTDSKEVTGSFDVDFRYATNKGGTSCPVLLLDSNKIDTENEAFVPALLHEKFYLAGREFKTGELNGVPVTLEREYREATEFNAGPELNIGDFDLQKNCLFFYGLGRFTKVEFNILTNKFNISASIQEPY